MDETEIIPIPTPRATYDLKITQLIKALLEVDETLFPAEISRDESGVKPKEVA
jgi:hypothetical protein